jgi:GntR family transcriptional repressor for pyruvate dehydrogenase complex
MGTARRAPSLSGILPLRSGRKSDEVFEQISEAIRGGRFNPGSRLPPERELAALFNASRPTIREALYRAELVGLIEVRHGTGSFVVAAAPREPTDRPLVELIKKEAHRIGEFFEIRRALEGWCAAHAARNATETDIAALKACIERMRALDVTDEAWESADIAFHNALAAATGNPIAVRIIEILREGFTAFYRFKRFVPNREEQQAIWQHHYDIYDAVRRRAPDEARQALVGHMDFIEAKLAESVSDIGV